MLWRFGVRLYRPFVGRIIISVGDLECRNEVFLFGLGVVGSVGELVPVLLTIFTFTTYRGSPSVSGLSGSCLICAGCSGGTGFGRFAACCLPSGVLMVDSGRRPRCLRNRTTRRVLTTCGDGVSGENCAVTTSGRSTSLNMRMDCVGDACFFASCKRPR